MMLCLDLIMARTSTLHATLSVAFGNRLAAISDDCVDPAQKGCLQPTEKQA